MTLLVKNEGDILEENLQFHHSMGVDAFIVTDNNSTDNTPAIIEKYRQKGWIIEVINETSTGYEQKLWVDRMVMLAKDKYKADWVINCDADEFWYTPLGSLKQECIEARGNVLLTIMRVMYPSPDSSWKNWEESVRAIPPEMQAELGLSSYTIFGRHRSKVAHRTAGYLHISMGNHKVAMFPRRRVMSGIVIYHYIWRGYDHFVKKVVNGGKELEKHSSKHGGTHWRYLYERYKQGCIDEEYRKVFAIDHLDKLRSQGYLVKDAGVIADFFSSL
ncbi:MAG: glycosyltransferase family 2 protein [Muribaculaceae bacterium]|nr:glycosyltransferase family 2 protein [Muribaculaceae bacterium]